MGRSTKKGPYVDPKLFEKLQKARSINSNQPIRTWARRCTIVPEFVGATFEVHNGKSAISWVNLLPPGHSVATAVRVARSRVSSGVSPGKQE